MNWLNPEQVSRVSESVGERIAIAGEFTGSDFEQIIADCFPGARRCNDKKWFDVIQPNRGIEAKTFQTGKTAPLSSNTYVDNVLKRLPPEAFDPELLLGNENIDPNADPQEIGRCIIEYLHNSMNNHAHTKGIDGDYVMSVLLRNGKASENTTTSVGYWEQPLHFGNPSDYSWSWTESGKGLAGYIDEVKVFTFYWKNAKQLFYRFTAPNNIQVFDVQHIETVSLRKSEYQEQLRNAFRRGFEAGRSSVG